MSGRSIKDLAGKRFGRLVALERTGKRWGMSLWRCICDCGNETTVAINNLTCGYTKSCGCLAKEWARRHAKTLQEKTAQKAKQRRAKGSLSRFKNDNGYVIHYFPEHPNANSRGYVAEHTVVMARFIGRPLEKGETVHHKNGVRDDNRVENLELWTKSHPPGQRVIDKIKWAKEIIELYGEMDTNS